MSITKENLKVDKDTNKNIVNTKIFENPMQLDFLEKN